MATGEFGQFVKSLEGQHYSRIQSLELVNSYVWTGSANGSLVVYDGKVMNDYKSLIDFRTQILLHKQNFLENIPKKIL
jgi:hypothetical protein